MSNLVIRRGDPESSGAKRLLNASRELMQALFPPESNHYLSARELRGSDALFFVAKIDGQTVGCAALALRDDHGEVKSMFVDPARRGARLGAKLLMHIESEARARGLSTLRLETGDRLVAAQRLYLAQGFGYCGPFGDYTDDPRSRYMEKKI
ncbi:MAG: GNAT family N-acetyltransferase [Paracoccaceae bacterium]